MNYLDYCMYNHTIVVFLDITDIISYQVLLYTMAVVTHFKEY